MPDAAQAIAVKAMDGLYLRAAAIAFNIANAGSDSFRPAAVDFERELRAAVARGPGALAEWNPAMRLSGPEMRGEDLRVDLQMADASETALRYSALTDLIGRRMQITRVAVRGGQ